MSMPKNRLPSKTCPPEFEVFLPSPDVFRCKPAGVLGVPEGVPILQDGGVDGGGETIHLALCPWGSWEAGLKPEEWRSWGLHLAISQVVVGALYPPS